MARTVKVAACTTVISTRSYRSKLAHENQDNKDYYDDADDTDAAVTKAVTVAAEAATEATKQENDEDDDEYESKRHKSSPLLEPNETLCLCPLGLPHGSHLGQATNPPSLRRSVLQGSWRGTCTSTRRLSARI